MVTASIFALITSAAAHTEEPQSSVALSHQGAAQHSSQNRAVAALLEELIARHELPGGMVAGIVHKDRLQAIGAAGYRKSGTNEAMTVHDKLHIGSCTKAMTATMIATLVEEGLLDWDSTLGEVLSDQEMHEAYRKVTLRQLLGHRAGLPRNAPETIGPDLAGWLSKESWTDRERRRALVATALKKPPLTPPGSQFAYSNLGYVVAGHLAERVSDKAWQDLMRDRLFTPLGMESAGFGPPGESGQTDQPWGHIELPLAGLTAVQRDNPAVIGPAGTIHCSLENWARFASLHLQHAPTEKPLLAKETISYMHEPLVAEADDEHRYSLGWIVAERDWARGQALTHAGSNTMWYAIIWLAPKRDLAFLVVTNCGDGFEACDEAISKLIELAERLER